MHELTYIAQIILLAAAATLALWAAWQARWRQPLPWAVLIVAAVMLARLIPG